MALVLPVDCLACHHNFKDWYAQSFKLVPSSYPHSAVWTNHRQEIASDCYYRNIMPVLTNGHLAQRLQENWMATQHPRIEQITNGSARETLDDSLTSLNWLQNLNMNYICGAATPPASPPMRIDPALREGMKVDPNQVLGTQACHPDHLNDCRYNRLEHGNTRMQFEPINYRTNPYVKPPYSYASLICMAMKACQKSKITLSSIYSWITDNFMYYRMADPSWQNSIRHNLSLNKCFEKVARRKDEPGKGGFWRMNPNYNKTAESGIPKKRKGSKKDNGDEPNSKKKSKKSKSINTDEDSIVDPFTVEKSEKERVAHSSDTHTSDLFSALSPPVSDENSDDYDDLLSADFSDDSTECPIGDPAHLAVQGIKIEPPEWWTDSLTGLDIKNILDNSMGALQVNTQANIPESHPWSVNKSDIEDAIAALEDVDTLLYNHSLTSPAP